MGAQRYRILHVFRAPVGGLFRHVLDVARAQAERGHAVGFFCDASTGGDRASQVLDEMRPLLRLGVTRVGMHRNPHSSDVTALLQLRRLVRELGPDVLHGHGSKGGLYARLTSGQGPAGPAIRAYTPHGGSFNYAPGTILHRAYMAAEAFLARRTEVFLFESEYIARRFRESVGATDGVIRVVHNGIGEAEFEPLARAETPFDLVYVGELRPAKGIGTLIEAMALLRRRNRRLRLLVVGSGPSEADLRAHAAAARVADSIAFEPPQPIRGALGRGRVMVIPSLAESLPYVILEAAAAAQPMVATDVGGIPEIFGPHAGRLIRPGDPQLLADAIDAKLAQSEAEREREAEQLSAFVRTRFCLTKMVDDVLAGYEAGFSALDLAGGARPRAADPAAPAPLSAP